MLRQRILTALLLIPPFVAALFYLPSPGVAALLGVFIALGAWEWGALIGLGRAWPRLAYVLALMLAGTAGVAAVLRDPGVLPVWFAAVALFWLWVFYELARGGGVHKSMFAWRPAKLASGFLILVPAWQAAVYLHAHDPRSPASLLFLFVLVWAADTGAYLFGHLFGRTRLAPAVSPGKTVEGVVGGVGTVMVLAYLAGTLVWEFTPRLTMLWVALAAVTALFSVVGDLVESKFKRLAGVKDSGALLPGHGGVLDRIDALTAAAPVFALGWFFLFKSSA